MKLSKLFFPLLAVLFISTSCKVLKPINIVPVRDPAMLTAIVQVHQMSDSLYAAIKTEPDKSFYRFETRYLIIKENWDSIYRADIERLKSNELITIVGKGRDMFQRHTDKHKQDIMISNALANVHAGQIGAILDALYLAENSLQKPKK
jgi:hypothetical protein